MIRILFIVICLITIAGCGPSDEKQTAALIDLVSDLPPAKTNIEGEWGNSVFMGSANLFLRPDGTFSYCFTSCTGKSISSGTWRRDRHFYVLVSEDKYKFDPEPEITSDSLITATDGTSALKIDEAGRVVIDTTFKISFGNMSTNIGPLTRNKYFDDDVLLLQGDSLVHLTKGGEQFDSYHRQKRI